MKSPYFAPAIILSIISNLALGESTYTESKENSSSSPWEEFFSIEPIKIPKEVDPQIGGLTISADGRLAVAFHRGEVMLYDTNQKTWTRFAEGLHEPLGIIAEADGSFLVGQRPEITRLKDTDGDGKADLYQTFFDDFGISGNYHEFNFGPTRDSKGNIYIGLGTASNHGMPMAEPRGTWSELGGHQVNDFIMPKEEWKKFRKTGEVSRMYSRVPYRGWVLKIAPDGKSYEPFALGFRTPNGVFAAPNDTLYVTDNQGDWLGMSKLFKVEKDKFYGHPVSLAWKKNWDPNKIPHKMPRKELNSMRERSIALLPSGDLANSPTGMTTSPGLEKFGLEKDQLIMGEMNQKRLVRYLPDIVNGSQQGTSIGFIEGDFLDKGSNRLLFDINNNLYVGKTHLSWAGSEGLLKIRWNGKPYLHITENKLTKEGFKISFSHPVEKSLQNTDQIITSHYGLNYHVAYGSKKLNETPVSTKEIIWSNDGKTANIQFAQPMKADQVYDIQLKGLSSPAIGTLLGDRLFYTAHVIQ